MTDTPIRADLIERLLDRKEADQTYANLATRANAAAALTAAAERIAALEGEVERLREREAELHGQLMRMIDRWEDQRA